MWVGRSPVDWTDPQHARALLGILFDVMDRVEPLADFRFELAGVSCIAEYEELEPGEVDVRLGWVITDGILGRPYIAEDGKPGVHFEIEEDDFHQVVLDSDTTSWRT